MCNFVPGECIAFGKRYFEKELPTDLLGHAKFIPLRYSEQEGEGQFDQFGFIHVTGIPRGMEIETVSQLSAAFPGPVRQKGMTVELNYYLPRAVRGLPSRRDLELSDPALAWARGILGTSSWPKPSGDLPPMVLIDSGVDPAHLASRPLTALDFSNGASGRQVTGNHDTNGHGTRVARILHESLPAEVPLISAKIADKDEQVTVLSLCRTFAEVVARYNPAVVNLSLAPLDDSLECPDGEKVRVPAFHSGILRRVFGLADRSFVVMAAGNQGQECNQRHVDNLVANLVFAVAVGSRLTRTRYSASPSGEGASELTTYAFGGDDDAEGGSKLGVFRGEEQSFGTSFAAPFISASSYAAAVACVRNGLPLHRAQVLGFEHFQNGGWYPDFVRHRGWGEVHSWLR